MGTAAGFLLLLDPRSASRLGLALTTRALPTSVSVGFAPPGPSSKSEDTSLLSLSGKRSAPICSAPGSSAVEGSRLKSSPANDADSSRSSTLRGRRSWYGGGSDGADTGVGAAPRPGPDADADPETEPEPAPDGAAPWPVCTRKPHVASSIANEDAGGRADGGGGGAGRRRLVAPDVQGSVTRKAK